MTDTKLFLCRHCHRAIEQTLEPPLSARTPNGWWFLTGPVEYATEYLLCSLPCVTAFAPMLQDVFSRQTLHNEPEDHSSRP